MALPPAQRLPELASTAAGSAVLATLAGLTVGAALVAKPLLVVALATAVLAVVGFVVALERPAIAFAGLVVVVALVPVYAAPKLGPLLLLPGAAASWLLAAALAWRNFLARGVFFRPNAVDYAVGAFVGLMAVSIAFSERALPSDYVHVMFLWIGPYLAGRLLLGDTERPMLVLAGAFGAVAVALAPIAIAETSGGSNPFLSFTYNATESAIWGEQADRFGQVRAEASFGHPIAFSMFAAVAALLALAMAINSQDRRGRFTWYAVAAVAVAIQAMALSRTGWLMLATGIVLLAAVAVQGSARRRVAILIGTAVLVVFLTWLVMPTELQVLPGFESKTDRVFTSSGQYREALLDRALQPGVLHLWGNPVNMVTPAVSGGTATDNAYIILADAWGLIPTAALIAVALALLYLTWRLYAQRTAALTVLPIVAFTCMVALFFVAFITQQQAMIWLLIGAAAAAWERVEAGETAPAQPRSSDLGRL
jgi:hypothetical protein